jgi:hypothetical protein
MSNKTDSIVALLADLDMQDYNKAYAASTAIAKDLFRGLGGGDVNYVIETWSALTDGIYNKMKKDRESVLSRPLQ